MQPLKEGLDYYRENGLMVLTEHYLRQRGYCCNQGCRHCPYPEKSKPQNQKNKSHHTLKGEEFHFTRIREKEMKL